MWLNELLQGWVVWKAIQDCLWNKIITEGIPLWRSHMYVAHESGKSPDQVRMYMVCIYDVYNADMYQYTCTQIDTCMLYCSVHWSTWSVLVYMYASHIYQSPFQWGGLGYRTAMAPVQCAVCGREAVLRQLSLALPPTSRGCQTELRSRLHSVSLDWDEDCVEWNKESLTTSIHITGVIV